MAADTVRGARKFGRYTLLVVLAVIVLFPIYAVVMQALKTGPDSLDHPRSPEHLQVCASKLPKSGHDGPHRQLTLAATTAN